MSQPEATHDLIRIERLLPNCLDHVWSAWASSDKKRAWFGDGLEQCDFAPGGLERSSFLTRMGVHDNETRYFEIRHRERIVFAYSMALNGRVHSVSLATVAFADQDGGTRLALTEQICIIPPSDGAKGRLAGWTDLLDSLADYLLHDSRTAA